MTYGERLRELRAERRLSLRQVEERGGPNKDTMSLIERDVHRPHPQTLGRIAAALEMSVSELRAELEAAEHPLAQAPPESLEEMLERRGVRTRYLSDKGLNKEKLDSLSLEEHERIARGVCDEVLAIDPDMRRLKHSHTLLWRELHVQVSQRYMTIRWSLYARQGKRFLSGETAEKFSETDRALAA